MADSPSLSSALTTAFVTLVSAAIGTAATIAPFWFGFASKDQDQVRLVEIAVGIFRADPKEGVAPARAWALDVIEKNSGVPFSKEDREALLQKPLAANFLDEWKGRRAAPLRRAAEANESDRTAPGSSSAPFAAQRKSGGRTRRSAALPQEKPDPPRLSIVVMPFSNKAAIRNRNTSSTASPRASRPISRASPARS
jgi:hypothetical protein